jgi:HEAT repeat protein
LKDNDRKYRNAALRFASCYADKVLYTELFKSLPKAKTGEKIDVLYWIGNEAQCPEKRAILKTIETGIEKTGTQTLIQLVNDTNVEVKRAAIGALSAIGDKPALAAIADLLKSNDVQVLSGAKEWLASFPDNISPALARVVSQASDQGKIIIMELLSDRKANVYFTMVLEQTKSASPEVRNKAYDVLKDVVSEKDFVILCGMLETAEPFFIKFLQQAVAASISSLAPEKQEEMISRRILQAGDAKKYLYDPVLPPTDDPATSDVFFH